MTKSRLYIYIIAGGYVAYTGLGLAKSALEERPDNYMMYLVIGIIFIAVGGFFGVNSVLKLSGGKYIDRKEETKDDSQENTKTSAENDMADDSGDR